MAEHDQRGEYLGERGSSVESESVPSRPTFAVPLLAEEGQAAASPPPTEQAAAVVPLQAGMTNPELALAWVSKVPGVKPTDEELRAFALGAEVGFARALSAAAPVVVQPAAALVQGASPAGPGYPLQPAVSAPIPGATCWRCKGSGDMEVTAGQGPDTWTETTICSQCGGTGAEGE